MKRRLIGRLARDYERGRRDARAGIYGPGGSEPYRHGHHDETQRMRERGEHPQCELALDASQPNTLV